MTKHFLFFLLVITPFLGFTQFHKTAAITENVLGTTYYDLQTAGSIPGRIWNNGDGTLSAAWAHANLSAPSYTDRGTGYSYYNGSSWGTAPTARIESVRSGWPSITTLKNGSEFILSHNASNIQLVKRTGKGTGAWTEDATTLKSPVGYETFWGRVTGGGSDGNSLHVIALTRPGVSYKGLNGAVTYSRSLNGGLSWDKVHTVIPGIDSASYLGFNSDNYDIDARGDTIAIVIGGYDRDVVVMKSTDNGTTWTKHIAFAFPIFKYNAKTMKTDINSDGIGDTLQSNDGAVSVLLDKTGVAHVFFGNMFVICTTPGSSTGQGLRILPSTDNLLYWNENMGVQKPVVIAKVKDTNKNNKLDLPTPDPGTFPYGRYQVSLTSHPSAGLGDDGALYVAYSSVLERYDNVTPKAFRHTYVMKSIDNGTTWLAPLDVFTDPYTECVFGSMARRVDANIHLMYQRDEGQGISIDPSGNTSPDYNENFGLPNQIVYAKIPTLSVGIAAIDDASLLYSIHPNPATDMVRIQSKEYLNDVEIRISNIMGQTLLTRDKTDMHSAEIVSLDVSGLMNGVYFLHTTIGKKHYAEKLLIRRY